MRRAFALILAVSSCAFAQNGPVIVARTGGAVGGAVGPAGNVFFASKGSAEVVQGAPYSGTITNESVQTLADGNRIVQTSSGTIARDSQGRTRQDAMLPPIGNLSAADAPHIVFIQDPISQTTYTLNLTDKTAQKMPFFGPAVNGATAISAGAEFRMKTIGPVSGSGPLPPPPPPLPQLAVQIADGDKVGPGATEDLGSKTMEGVYVTGVRTTFTIVAGQIGNDKSIEIVTEVWTSPDLKTIVYSKHSDPRIGEMTFKLTNVNRSEPDSTQFSVPADFKVMEGPQPLLYRTNQ